MIKSKTILLMLFLLGFFAISHDVRAEQINLPKDADGWTIFTPSEDTRIVYVSSDGDDSTGLVYTQDNHPDWNNPFEPGVVEAFATIEAAYANTRDAYPDWILIRRGDKYSQGIRNHFRSGRSSTEPFLVAAYGSTGPSPLFEADNGIYYDNKGFSWVAFSGLSFYANTADPDNPAYDGSEAWSGFNLQTRDGEVAQGLLIEGCQFRFFEENEVGVLTYNTGVFEGATIRRTSILDTYTDGYTQGLWSWHIDDLVVEECIFDHNGWYEPTGGSIGPASSLSHSTYFSSDQNVTLRNNIFSRSAGVKFIADADCYGHEIDGNLFIDNEVGISIGNNKTENLERFFDTSIVNNVFFLTGLNNPTGSSAKWDIWASGWVGGNISSNIFLNRDVIGPNSSTLRFYDNMIDVDIADNIDIGQVDSVFSVYHIINTEGTSGSNITFAGNKIEASGNYQKFFQVSSKIEPTAYTFSNNTWYSPADTVFLLGGQSYTEEEWLSGIETTASFTQPSYRDRERDVEAYMASLGMTPSAEVFIAKIRAQDRYDWDQKLTALATNEWIREGFILTASSQGYRFDVDASGETNTRDALLTLRRTLGLDMNALSWQDFDTTGDANCDNILNSADALLILRFSLGFDMNGTPWCG